MPNLEFLQRYARPGCIGLVGATSAIDRAIRKAQRPLVAGGGDSLWSHVFLFQGRRVDGHHWIIESDIDATRGQMRFGVQENRLDKYADDAHYPNLAVLRFDLKPEMAEKVISSALDFVTRRTRYAVGGLFQTYWAMVNRKMDREEKRDSTYCSSLVRAVFHDAGIDLVPGVAVNHTTPEHVAQTPVPHRRHELVRQGK